MHRTILALTDLSLLDERLCSKEAAKDHFALRLQERRCALRKIIPDVFLTAYDALDRVGRRPVVVQVRAAHCGGCFLRLPPQLDSAIRRRQSLCACPHCRRLLYVAPPEEKIEKTDEGKRRLRSTVRKTAAGKRARRSACRPGRQALVAAERRESRGNARHRTRDRRSI